MSRFIDATGGSQQVEPSLDWYRAAADNNMSLEQWVNTKYQTDAAQYGSSYNQILASEGIVLKPNKVYGLRPNTIAQIEKGIVDVNALVKDSEFSSAALRLLFPSAILSAVEDKLVADLNMSANTFDSLVAYNDVIQGDKFERPQLNYSRPEKARSNAVAQLSEPNVMLSITASSYSRTIPTLSIGMLIAEQAAKNTTLDLVALALARQVATERMLRAREYFQVMLNGDVDLKGEGPGSATLVSIVEAKNGAGSSQMVNIDAAATSGISHLGWMRWLYRNSTTRVIDWVITDLAGAMALENRAGKPVITTDNPNSTRIDSVINVGNPTWKSSVNVFITDDPNWPAKTIMGMDSRYGIARVSSSTIQYSAVEEYVMRRAKGLRIDFGEIAYRLYDDAFDVFTYA